MTTIPAHRSPLAVVLALLLAVAAAVAVTGPVPVAVVVGAALVTWLSVATSTGAGL
jgi:hypothetical protein